MWQNTFFQKCNHGSVETECLNRNQTNNHKSLLQWDALPLLLATRELARSCFKKYWLAKTLLVIRWSTSKEFSQIYNRSIDKKASKWLINLDNLHSFLVKGKSFSYVDVCVGASSFLKACGLANIFGSIESNIRTFWSMLPGLSLNTKNYCPWSMERANTEIQLLFLNLTEVEIGQTRYRRSKTI